ncbi:MAG TPA: hypothetical protein QGF58_19170 [Myxococcota bacterium]|nr:hypothetical protein [Myxococcota bacterium]
MRPWLLALGVYALGSVVFTLPMPLELDSSIWGDRFDAWTTIWLIWHLADGILSGQLQEVTELIFYPVGYNLWSFGHMGIQLLGIPLIALGVGLTATYNLLLLGAFTASGLCGHALGHRLSGSHWGGFLAGAIFAWNPYTYGEMSAGCVELVGAWFIPLYALMLIRVCDKPTWQRAAWAAVVLACVGPFNWYYTAFLGMFTGVFLAWRVLAGGRNRNKAVAWIVVAALVAGVSNVPLISKARRETPSRSLITAETFSPENWAEANRIANGSVPLEDLDVELLELNDAMQVAINSTSLVNLTKAAFPPNPLESTPGRMAYAFGLFGLVMAGRRGRPWALMALGFSVLTLGPYLQIDATPPIPDWSLASPLPYYGLYNEVPFFAKAYRPYRIGVIVLLCLSALAATGLARMRWRWRFAVPVAAVLLCCTQPHWSGVSAREMSDAEIPVVYEQVAELEPGAIIELPLHYQPVTPANARFQYYQVVHGKPLLNCNQLIRRTDLARFQEYVAANSFVETVLDLGRKEGPYSWLGEDLESLHEQGFRYVIAHTSVERDSVHLGGFNADADRLKQPAWDMLRETFGEPLLVGEDGTWVYAVPSQIEPGEHRWEATWEDVPVEWAELDLPVTLAGDGLLLELGGPAERLSFWVLAEGEFVVEAGEPIPVVTREGAWTWVEVELGGASSVMLSPRSEELVLRLDAVQVLPSADSAVASR